MSPLDTAALMRQHPFPSRERYDGACGASPAPITPAPLPHQPGAGEVAFTPGQKAALLKLRHSDWTKAVLNHLVAFGQADCSIEDCRSLAALKLAINKGSFHVLTDHGRWKADRVAAELARELDMHIITISLHPRHYTAADAKCICGWRTRRTHAVPSYAALIRRDARFHLERVSVVASASENESAGVAPAQQRDHRAVPHPSAMPEVP